MPMPTGRRKAALPILAAGLAVLGLVLAAVYLRRPGETPVPALGPDRPAAPAEGGTDAGKVPPEGGEPSGEPGTPGSRPVPLPPRPGRAVELVPALDRWLQAGGRPEDLSALAAAWQAWDPGDSLTPADLDGDGRPEYLLPLRWSGADPAGFRAGYLVAVRADGDAWRAEPVPIVGEPALAEGSTPEDPTLPPPVLNPGLVATADFDGRGGAEVVAASQSCGAHTCFLTVSVLRRDPGGWQSLLTVPEVPGGQARLDGTEVWVTAAGVGSVGAGPQRPETWVYRWDGGGFSLASHTRAPSRYAHFRLVDGAEAAREGDLARARQLYQEVLTASDQLEYWTDPALEAPFLRALARFRLLVLAALAGRTDEVAALAEAAEREDGPYARWSQAFVAAAGPGASDVLAGCRAAARVWGLSPTEPPAYWGYSHEPFGPENLCAGVETDR
nr:MAG: hypothetical protein DIU70_04585 [Bacillota bacterium]